MILISLAAVAAVLFILYISRNYSKSKFAAGSLYVLLIVAFVIITATSKSNTSRSNISKGIGVIIFLIVANRWNNKWLFGALGLYILLRYGPFQGRLFPSNIIKVVFWLSVLFIFHILWIILTFTSPTADAS